MNKVRVHMMIVILWLNKEINERQKRIIPTVGTSMLRTDPISSIKNTPTQYYSTYQPKYISKGYGAQIIANQEPQFNKYSPNYGGISTEHKSKSPIDEVPDSAIGIQILQKDFSASSMSSYPSGRAPETKVANPVVESMASFGIEKKDVIINSTEESNEAAPEPQPIPDILPIKYMKP